MRVAIRAVLVSLGFLLSVSGDAPAADSKLVFTGVVDSVTDGGLIRVILNEGQKVQAPYNTCSKVYSTMAWVRLYAVNAPDPLKKELCGKEAKEFLKNMAQGKSVKVEIIGCPPNGGVTGVVMVDDGFAASRDVSLELVKAGLSKVAIPGASTNPSKLTGKYFEAEKSAMMEGRGLWGKKKCSGIAKR